MSLRQVCHFSDVYNERVALTKRFALLVCPADMTDARASGMVPYVRVLPLTPLFPAPRSLLLSGILVMPRDTSTPPRALRYLAAAKSAARRSRETKSVAFCRKM